MRSPLRTESSGSVAVTWLDRAAAVRLAEELARDLVARHPEVTGVLLFGSLIRGDAVPGSDIDLLVVLSHADEPYLERLATYDTGVGAGIGVDLLPYTVDEVLRLERESGIVRSALAEGRWLVGPPPALH